MQDTVDFRRSDSRPTWLHFFLVAVFSLLVAFGTWLGSSRVPVVEAQVKRDFHVSWQALPTSTAAANIFEGGNTTTKRLNLGTLILNNTDASNAHTVLITDNTPVTPLILLSASIPAATLWTITYGGTLVNGLKWSASSVTVQGSVVGVN